MKKRIGIQVCQRPLKRDKSAIRHVTDAILKIMTAKVGEAAELEVKVQGLKTLVALTAPPPVTLTGNHLEM